MIYDRSDVNRMLDFIRTELEKRAWFYKNDHIPPKVVTLKQIKEVLEELEKTL